MVPSLLGPCRCFPPESHLLPDAMMFAGDDCVGDCESMSIRGRVQQCCLMGRERMQDRTAGMSDAICYRSLCTLKVTYSETPNGWQGGMALLLQDTLSGEAQIALFVCCSPAASDAVETLPSLRFQSWRCCKGHHEHYAGDYSRPFNQQQVQCRQYQTEIFTRAQMQKLPSCHPVYAKSASSNAFVSGTTSQQWSQ